MNLEKIKQGIESIKHTLSKRQKLIAKIGAIFFVALFILTIASNSISNALLPQVIVTSVQKGVIYKKVRGNGVIMAKHDYSVYTDQSVKIEEVHVQPGDVVSANQILLTCTNESSQDLESEKDSVLDLKLSYQQALLDASSTYGTSDLLILNAKTELELAIKEGEELPAIQNRITWLQNEITEKQRAVDAASNTLEEKENELEKYADAVSMNGLEKKKEKAEKAVTKARENYATLKNELTLLEEELAERKSGLISKEESTKKIIEKEVALRELLLQKKKSDLDFDNLEQKLEKKEEQLKELEEKRSTPNILAPISGVVSDIYFQAGDVVNGNTVVVIINQIEQGYTVSFPVSKKQSEYVFAGDKAEILNIWDSDIEANLHSIVVNPEDPNNSRILNFLVQGEDVVVSSNLALSVGEQQEQYDKILPNNCIYEDNQGKFVLVLEEKGSPLGNRFFARRRSIEVLQSDDMHSAISGDIQEGMYVITESMKPLESGMKVRLVN